MDGKENKLKLIFVHLVLFHSTLATKSQAEHVSQEKQIQFFNQGNLDWQMKPSV